MNAVSGLDTCSPKVFMTHSSGCMQKSALKVVHFLTDNVWLYASILILFGAFTALLGNQMFPHVMAFPEPRRPSLDC